ncbi:hypothetical protein [Oceanomicrobium pacificus]|uniref:Uncharacterized protein n=1 Tax=Oceanomicrobium pacificus TaxID=2692916 RepID=A0A6B0TSG2_9RHOB|nr:hypothetical protein [Oceanomicrobium pacificus]MXU64142.1 hypothetical protein [Oceanomicrobium pacificus]
MRPALLLFTCLMPLPLAAQDESPGADGWAVAAGDRRFGASDLADRLAGQVVEFMDGSKSHYRDGNRYAYTYEDGGPEFTGAYAVGADGTVCVTFDNDARRCDLYVLNADGVLTLITTDGYRFRTR